MRNKTMNLTGTGKVYRFTVKQMFKSKANIISLVILFLFSLLTLPVETIMSGADTAQTVPSVLYLKNETELPVDAGAVVGSLNLKKEPSVVDTDKDDEALSAGLLPAEAAIVISEEGGSVSVRAFQAPGYAYDRSSLDRILAAFTEETNRLVLRESGITEDFIASLADYRVNVSTQKDYLNPSPDEEERMGAFGVQYVYAILLLMLCTISSSYIVRSVIEEKTSRLVELLMVSVSSLALLVGKILAVMTYILVLYALLFLGFFLSWTVTSHFFDVSAMTGMIQAVAGGRELGQIAAQTVIVVLVSLALGFLLYSLLAGMIGASCGSMEDTESANMSVMLVTLSGYVISCVVAPLAVPAVDIVTSLIPFTAVYVAPVLYLIGRIGLPVLILSWAIQAVCIVLLARLAAGIYHELLLSRGQRLGVGKLFVMALGGRKEKAA